MATEPDVKIFELYGVHAPGFGRVVQTASV
jgi:hypothetical protein